MTPFPYVHITVSNMTPFPYLTPFFIYDPFSVCTYHCIVYGVALVSRIDKFIGLFCKRAQPKSRYSAKETYNFIDPTNQNHPQSISRKCISVHNEFVRINQSVHKHISINTKFSFPCVYFSLQSLFLVSVCQYTYEHVRMSTYVWARTYEHVRMSTYVWARTYILISAHAYVTMGWLRVVGSLQSYVSCAEYSRVPASRNHGFWPSQRVSKHTLMKSATQPASVVSINH